MSLNEQRTIKLQWEDVCSIVSSEIESILDIKILCKANVVENEFWDIQFLNYCMPLHKFCELLQRLNATPEDWKSSLPDEGGREVSYISMFIAEKMIEKHLNLTWEHSLVTVESLWLVGLENINAKASQSDVNGCKMSDELVQAIMTIAHHLYQQEERI